MKDRNEHRNSSYTAKHNDTARCKLCKRVIRLEMSHHLTDGTPIRQWHTTITPKQSECAKADQAGWVHKADYRTLTRAADVGQGCGTNSAYARHLRNNEPPCDACRKSEANRLRQHRRKNAA